MRRLWLEIYTSLIFHEILQTNKLEGDHFKYDDSFFEIIIPKYPNKAFFVPNLLQNFAVRPI